MIVPIGFGKNNLIEFSMEIRKEGRDFDMILQ